MPIDPNDWQAQQYQLQKQQQLAQMLRGQANQDVGQTVGGRVVAASPFQILAKLGSGYFANDAEAKANTTAQNIAKTKQAAMAEALRKYGETQDPTVLTSSGIPELQAAGVKNATTPTQMKIAPNGAVYNPLTVKPGTSYAENKIAPNGAVYDPNAIKPGQNFAPMDKAFNPATGAANPEVQAYELGKSKAGATKIGITNNTEKSYAGHVAEGLAKNDVAAIDMGKTGVQAISAAQGIKKALDSGKMITGTLANQRLAGKQLAATLGFTNDTEDLSQTRSAMVGMGQLILNARKQMQGQGQVTDKESALAERVAGGDISMTPAEIRTMADAAERVGRLQVRNANKVATRLKGDKNFGSVGQDLLIEEPPEYLGSSDKKPTQSNW